MLPQVGMPTHKIDGDKHDAAGLTPGDVLTALTATTFGFQAAGGGAVEAVAVIFYTGDASNNRDVNMGVECDFVMLFPRTAYGGGNNHVALAYAESNVYGVFMNVAATKVEHSSMANADSYFQGLQAATNNVRLGSNGASPYGTNVNAALYTIVGFKFA